MKTHVLSVCLPSWAWPLLLVRLHSWYQRMPEMEPGAILLFCHPSALPFGVQRTQKTSKVQRPLSMISSNGTEKQATGHEQLKTDSPRAHTAHFCSAPSDPLMLRKTAGHFQSSLWLSLQAMELHLCGETTSLLCVALQGSTLSRAAAAPQAQNPKQGFPTAPSQPKLRKRRQHLTGWCSGHSRAPQRVQCGARRGRGWEEWPRCGTCVRVLLLSIGPHSEG